MSSEIEMCQEPGCVLAANHPEGRHREYRVSMLACPHNVPNFGRSCPICDTDSVRLAAEINYKLYVDPNGRR